MLRVIAIILGGLQTWKSRHVIFSDGISYLDIADAYLRHDWANAINAYWSPLYSWILAVFSAIFRPHPAWSVPLLHCVNFLSFLASLVALEYFLVRLARYTRVGLLPASWLILGYCLAIWSGLTRVTIDYVSPDILVTALTFWICGVLVGLRDEQARSRRFLLLGVLLGIAYFAKGIFFALAIMLYIPASLIALNRNAVKNSGFALTAFLATCAPFIAALSLQKGRFTFGDTGPLNYGWEVLGAARSTHWQGEPFDIGTPKHPTEQVIAEPATYVFPEPVGGTYPPWYDPSYWYEGIAPRFKLGAQLTVLTLSIYYTLIQGLLTPGALVLTVLILGSVVPRWLALHALRRYWFLLLPSAGAIASYCLVFVDRRYIPGFLAVLVMALWATVQEQIGHLRWPSAVVIASAVLTTVGLLSRGDVIGFAALRHDSPIVNPASNWQWTIAQGAEAAGMPSAQRIAYIGLAMSADWLRLSKHRVVGEITVLYHRDIWPARRVILNEIELHKFWRLDESCQEEVFEQFRRAGAQWVAADYVPFWADIDGWCVVGGNGVNETFIRPLAGQTCVEPE